MNDLIEAIRIAIARDAPAETRAAGIDACRMILAALGATPGEPMLATAAPTPSPIAAIVAGLRGVPPDQLLDLAIAKLRSIVPAEPTPAPTGFKYLRVPLQKVPSP